MEDLASQVMAIAVPAITTVIGLLVAWGLAELRKYIAGRTKNEAALQAFDTVADLVHNAVTSVNQTTRKVFEDGKLSESEKVQYRTEAKAVVMNQIPAATRKILDANLKDLEEYVGRRIETEVYHASPPIKATIPPKEVCP